MSLKTITSRRTYYYFTDTKSVNVKSSHFQWEIRKSEQQTVSASKKCNNHIMRSDVRETIVKRTGRKKALMVKQALHLQVLHREVQVSSDTAWKHTRLAVPNRHLAFCLISVNEHLMMCVELFAYPYQFHSCFCSHGPCIHWTKHRYALACTIRTEILMIYHLTCFPTVGVHTGESSLSVKMCYLALSPVSKQFLLIHCSMF